MIVGYLKKGKNFAFPASVCRWHVLWSWFGAFSGIALVSLLSSFVLEGTGLTLIIGSFGASAVLVYGAVEQPL